MGPDVVTTVRFAGDGQADLEAVKKDLPLATTHRVVKAAALFGLRAFRKDAKVAAQEMLRCGKGRAAEGGV
jgi:hypothetical protein